MELESGLNFPSEVVFQIRNRNIEGANELMINYYLGNIDRIFEELKHRHPKRTELLNQILFSYKNENYLIVIPCILAQID